MKFLTKIKASNILYCTRRPILRNSVQNRYQILLYFILKRNKLVVKCITELIVTKRTIKHDHEEKSSVHKLIQKYMFYTR